VEPAALAVDDLYIQLYARILCPAAIRVAQSALEPKGGRSGIWPSTGSP
jgi:hypothetical protein